MSAPVKYEKFFKFACLFEGSLILVAMLLGWLVGINPFEYLHFDDHAFAIGLFGTMPLFLIFMALYSLESDALQKIRQTLLDTLAPSMHRYHWTDLLVLAAIAGISEELLFRGVIQPWMESTWGMTAGLIGSNIIFGLVHAVTPVYALLAGAVGIYLGLFLDVGEQRNLLTPIVIHGFYDFLAFLVIMRTYRTEQTESNDK